MSKINSFLYGGIIFCLGALFGSVMELNGKTVISTAQAERIEEGWRAVRMTNTGPWITCFVLIRPDNTVQNVNGFSCVAK